MTPCAPASPLMQLRLAIIPNPLLVSPDCLVGDVLELMNGDPAANSEPGQQGALAAQKPLDPQQICHQKGRSGCVVVATAGAVVGLLTAADIVRLGAQFDNFSRLPVGQVMACPRMVLQATDLPDLTDPAAMSRLGQELIQAPIPVCSAGGALVGILTAETWLGLMTHPAPPVPLMAAASTQGLGHNLPVSQGVKPAGGSPLVRPGELTSPGQDPGCEQNLQASETMLHDIISSTKACIVQYRLLPEGSWIYDFYSEGSELIFGYGSKELMEQPNLWPSRVVPEDFQTILMPAMKAVMAGQPQTDLEFRFRHRDGSIRWIKESCNARWDSVQQCWVVTNVAIDITQRQRMEAQLRQSEAELRGLFEAMDDVVLVLNQEGRYLKVVTTNTSNLYRPASELMGKTLEEVFSPTPGKQFQAIIRQVLATGETHEFEYVLEINGQNRWFSAKCSPIAINLVIWVARDISDRKQSELSLRQSEAKRRAILAAMPDLMFRLGADARYREVINARPDLELFFQGCNPIGQRLPDLVPADIANRKLAMMEQALATGELQLYEQQMQTDQGPRHEEVRVIKSGDDEVLFIIRDISDRKLAQQELEATRNLLQQVLDHLPVAVFAKDANTLQFTLWNAACRSLMGSSPEAVIGKNTFELFPPERAESFVAQDRQAIQQRTLVEIPEEVVQGPDGQPRIIHTRKVAVYDPNGDANLVIGIAEDITQRKRSEQMLKQQLAAIEAAVDGIGILRDETYLYINQSHLMLFGYDKAADLVGKNWRELYAPEEIQRFEQEIFPLLKRDRAWQGEAIALRRDGSTFAEGLSLTLTDDNILICVCRDISELKQAQAQIIHNALHDPLTGLPNRTLLEERLAVAIQRAKRYAAYRYAVLFIDLDRFKMINDSLGHLMGDKLLVAIAKRLQSHIRGIDLAARLGGDEFVLLLEDIDGPDTVAQIAERILASCQTPLIIDGHEVFTGMSIGIAIGSDTYTLASDLIRDADIAMYRAKQNRQASYQFFGRSMRTAILERHTLEMELHRAIELHELVVHYQPIFDLRQTQLVGFEALVRWHHPTRGYLPPHTFLSCAEESGLIVPIDRWVLAQAGDQLRQWHTRFAPELPLTMHVNLSAQNFTTGTLLHSVDQVMADVDLAYPWLTVEITENILIDDIDNATHLLNQLASRQIQTSIDDFGIGYSSLQYLQRLPLNSLKIDRSFVHQIDTSDRDYQMVRTIVGLGQQLNLAIIAEGIENHHQRQLIQALGCQCGQGYLFSRPLPAGEIEKLVFLQAEG